MRAWTWLTCVVLGAGWMLACGSEDPTTGGDDDGASSGAGLSGTPGSGGSGAAGTGSGAAGTGGSPSGGGGGEPPAVNVCLPTCASPSDCATPAPAFDADNYACDGGLCSYLGCHSDAECQPSGLVCRPEASLGYEICVTPCQSPADCDLGQPAYDVDNYDCVQGGCVYTGCNDTAECQASGDLVCHDYGFGRFCVEPCSAPGDCGTGQPAFDADNYACNEGICEYTGCNSDAECQSLGAYGCG